MTKKQLQKLYDSTPLAQNMETNEQYGRVYKHFRVRAQVHAATALLVST